MEGGALWSFALFLAMPMLITLIDLELAQMNAKDNIL